MPPTKFTGKERDTETGLDFFQARYMSAAQGRFTSPDPLGNFVANAADPQTWNLYAYARNNPLVFVDPTGLACVYAGADNGTAADWADPTNYIDDNNGGQTCAEVNASPPEEEDVSASWNNDAQSDDFGNVTFFATGTAQNPGQSGGPQLVPKTTVAQCMLQNQDSFSLAALVDQGAGMIGLHTNVGNTFVGNLLLGNDVMGVSSILLGSGSPDGTLASGVSQSASRGIVNGVGQPLRIGGNTGPTVQKLFPKRGRPPQALVRSKGLSSALGIAADVLDGKDVIDISLTAGLAFACFF